MNQKQGRKKELGAIISDKEEALNAIYKEARRNDSLRQLLNQSLRSLYRHVPEAGGEKYGGMNPGLGFVLLADAEEEGNFQLDLIYRSGLEGYDQAYQTVALAEPDTCEKIGTIYPENRRYQLRASEELDQVPEVVLEDTELVMQELGLEK